MQGITYMTRSKAIVPLPRNNKLSICRQGEELLPPEVSLETYKCQGVKLPFDERTTEWATKEWNIFYPLKER